MTQVWEKVVSFWRSVGEPIDVYVSPTADAAAACATFAELLTSTLIPHNLHPVFSFSDLRRLVGQRQSSEISSSLHIVIGLGHSADLTSIFPKNTIGIVLDSHRPVLLTNLAAASQENSNIFLWNNLIFEEVSQTLRKLQRKRARSTESGDSEDDNDVDVDWRVPETVSDELLSLYNATQYSGSSCAWEMRLLAVLLNRSKEASVWHAAIGVTDVFLRAGQELHVFKSQIDKLRDTVVQLNALRRTRLGEVQGNSNRNTGTSDARLICSDEEPLMLLRHWTLWDATVHHPVTSCLLGLHRADEGQERLRSLLATCGIAAKRAQQGWMEIPLEERDIFMHRLRHAIEQMAQKAPLVRYCVLPTIGRVVGYNTEVSAFDACRLFDAVCHSMTAANDPRAQLEAFWKAFEVLRAEPNSSAFNQAVSMCKTLNQRLSAATSALVQRSTVTFRTLHYVACGAREGYSAALEHFHSPRLLQLLGTRLRLALASDKGRWKLALPLLIARPKSVEGRLSMRSRMYWLSLATMVR